jgi:sulfofructose kinase
MTIVLLAGVAVLDFVFSVDAMPRRAEKYRALDAAVVGGGCAANAAVAIARLGGTARFSARVGADPVGDIIVSELLAEAVDCSLVKRFEGKRSSFSSVLVDAQGERQIVNFRDETLSFEAGWLEDAMPASFDAALVDTRWPEGGAAVLKTARRLSRPGVIDAEVPVAEAAEALTLASHIAFSAQGLREYTGLDDLQAGLRLAQSQAGAWVCYTDGANGVTFSDGDAMRHVPAFAVESIDTLGAGDVWHGAFALALGEGHREEDAIVFANAVAAIKCTKFGGRAGIPNRAETEAFMRRKR